MLKSLNLKLMVTIKSNGSDSNNQNNTKQMQRGEERLQRLDAGSCSVAEAPDVYI